MAKSGKIKRGAAAEKVEKLEAVEKPQKEGSRAECRKEKAENGSIAEAIADIRWSLLDQKASEWGFVKEPSDEYPNKEWLKLFLCFRENYRWADVLGKQISDDEAAKYLAEIAVITKAYRFCEGEELERFKKDHEYMGNNRLIAAVEYTYPTFKSTPDGMRATVLGQPRTRILPIWEGGSPGDDPKVSKAIVEACTTSPHARGYSVVSFSSDRKIGRSNGNVYGLFQKSDPMEKFVYEAIYWEERRLLAEDWRGFKDGGAQYVRISDTPGYLYGEIVDDGATK